MGINQEMKQAIERHSQLGGFFFSEGTMKFWKSKVEAGLFDGGYFVTSEPNYDGTNRRYSVRQFSEDRRYIETVGEFRQFARREDAVNYIEALQRQKN